MKGHDFLDKKLGKAIPYGVYDIAKNKGFVSVGIDKDTAEFAVQTIRRWWHGRGQDFYPHATELLITAYGISPRRSAGKRTQTAATTKPRLQPAM